MTYKGEPLHIGSVVMIPDGGGPAAEANITREGTFTMGTYDTADGAIPGKHKVMILALTSPGGSGLPEDSIKGDVAPISIIPEFYGDLAKSGLAVDIKEGSNKIDFVLGEKKAEIKQQ